MDALGSVRFLLDSSQNVSVGYDYEAFGREVAHTGQTPNPYHFVGEYGYYQDWETGLQLLTARYYDVEVGRFVTRDPIGFGGGDWNIYGYVRDAATRLIDPSGNISKAQEKLCIFWCNVSFSPVECEDVACVLACQYLAKYGCDALKAKLRVEKEWILQVIMTGIKFAFCGTVVH
jgi:RHS repeat-associated protein